MLFKHLGTFALITLLSFTGAKSAVAQSLTETSFDIGTPTVTDLYVNSVTGNDSNSGTSADSPFETVTAAWNSIPQGSTLTSTGYRINLAAGTYPEESLPNYWESRYGTYQYPIIFQATDGRGSVILAGDANMFDSRYVYFIDVNFIPSPAGDAFHCEQCDHILIRRSTLSGGNREAHETIKINQSQYIYIEDSDISGADDNAIDFVSVQYGHLVRNRIHNAQDWCLYTKGGSAYIRVEGNEIYDCGVGGFTAGQGSGLEFMTSPWIHYEAYDIKFINNVIHDTEGAAFGVNGGYNIFIGHNTAYKVGTRSHLIELVPGLRSCDGNATACATRLAAGGWGTTTLATEGEPIPNRNVYIYNNVIYNPTGTISGQHFTIQGPRTPNTGTNISDPVNLDTNVKIRGNVIWNGPGDTPLGIEDSDQGCQPSNPTCNATQLAADNSINSIEPSFRGANTNDFRPTASGNLFSATTYEPIDFTGGDREATPLAAEGNLVNDVTRDRSGATRSASTPPGAYATADAELANTPPTIENARISKRTAKRKKFVTVSATITDDASVASAYATIGSTQVTLAGSGSSYSGRYKVKGRPGRRTVTVYAQDGDGELSSESVGTLRVKK